MVDVLDNKRVATRLRILVEIAERQPAVSQSEIADEVGVTSQAVSEYIRELVDDGFGEKEARSRYRVMNEAAAIATDDISEGETVFLSMREGYIHAAPSDGGDATAVATTDADAGGDVGVAEREGVIDLEPGTVTVVQIPPVRAGGAGAADLSSREGGIEAADLVVASGV